MRALLIVLLRMTSAAGTMSDTKPSDTYLNTLQANNLNNLYRIDDELEYAHILLAEAGDKTAAAVAEDLIEDVEDVSARYEEAKAMSDATPSENEAMEEAFQEKISMWDYASKQLMRHAQHIKDRVW